jgi:hypothetical protein
MKSVVVMGLDAMVYVLNQFNKDLFWNSKFVREDTHIDTQTHREQSDLISLLFSLILKK